MARSGGGGGESAFDFTLDEYRARLDALRHRMRSSGIDVLIVDQLEHLVYLFGYLPTAARYQACIVPLDGSPRMIVRSMDLSGFRTYSWLDTWRDVPDFEDPVAVLAEELRAAFPKGRIGFEGDSHIFTVERFLQLKAALPEAELVDCGRVLIEQRLIKSDSELAYLRKAAGIADACMAASIAAAGAGISEREAAVAAYATAMRTGADNGRVLLSASGRLSGNLHGRLENRILAEGDILHLEMVPQVRGYSSRLMRPVFIGTPSAEATDIAGRILEIQDAQFAAMRPDVPGRDVDRIAREGLKSRFGIEYRNHTGYTLGHHAQPRTSDMTRIFTPISDWPLKPGMVFHMFLSIRGISMGETIHVTASGNSRLTHTERRMFVK